MTKIDLDELERKAKACPSGLWNGTEGQGAVGPPVVLALIARIRDLEAEVGKMLASAHPHPVEHPTMTEAWISARAVLEKGAVSP